MSHAATLARPYARAAFSLAREDGGLPAWSDALGFAAQITPGALLAFLLLGPVIDIKLVGLLGLLFRPRGLVLTTAGAALAVLLIGQWVNLWRL